VQGGTSEVLRRHRYHPFGPHRRSRHRNEPRGSSRCHRPSVGCRLYHDGRWRNRQRERALRQQDRRLPGRWPRTSCSEDCCRAPRRELLLPGVRSFRNGSSLRRPRKVPRDQGAGQSDRSTGVDWANVRTEQHAMLHSRPAYAALRSPCRAGRRRPQRPSRHERRLGPRAAGDSCSAHALLQHPQQRRRLRGLGNPNTRLCGERRQC